MCAYNTLKMNEVGILLKLNLCIDAVSTFKAFLSHLCRDQMSPHVLALEPLHS